MTKEFGSSENGKAFQIFLYKEISRKNVEDGLPFGQLCYNNILLFKVIFFYSQRTLAEEGRTGVAVAPPS